MLSNSFREDEILEVVRDCGGFKSFIFDGFNFNFIKNYSDGLGVDLNKNFIVVLCNRIYIQDICNVSFVILILKS